ncbi:hypothetical protein J1N35_008138 [Gossypium stocksii]|uniref:Uncharacterized protein n=1 Tax=Gossypium stocksii TaxID=47602 RepID=A0A9D3WAG7_9ROSI|nr:hypothetical protein J1N35_008138 [Gossypium stocksii]
MEGKGTWVWKSVTNEPLRFQQSTMTPEAKMWMQTDTTIDPEEPTCQPKGILNDVINAWFDNQHTDRVEQRNEEVVAHRHLYRCNTTSSTLRHLPAYASWPMPVGPSILRGDMAKVVSNEHDDGTDEFDDDIFTDL